MGKRGFKGKGYSLKWINRGYYCYVWEEFDSQGTRERRQEGSKSYSRSNGWKSLGNWSKSETHHKLEIFLQSKYGYNETEMDGVLMKIQEEIYTHSKE